MTAVVLLIDVRIRKKRHTVLVEELRTVERYVTLNFWPGVQQPWSASFLSLPPTNTTGAGTGEDRGTFDPAKYFN
jgi:hypothetical protein